jgi:glycosyltransferase involved in cell wall biosynthesis
MTAFNPDISVIHKENFGVAKGYNHGYVLATGDWIVITGCDMLMPENWLVTMKEYLEKVPQTGIACMYSQPMDKVPERIRGERTIVNGMDLWPALPFGRRIVRRDLFKDIGYLREDFGLYGWEDVEWGERALRICKEKDLMCYAIPDKVAEHLGTEGVKMADGKDPADYHAFKRAEVHDPKKIELMNRCRAEGYQYYNPFM